MAKSKKKETIEKANFSDPIYCRNYEIYFGKINSVKNWYCDNYNIILDDGLGEVDGLETAAFAFYDPKRSCYIMVFGKKLSPELVAHECSHIAKILLEHIGYRSKAEDDEPEAYLLTFLVRMVYHSFRQVTQKRKKKKLGKSKRTPKKGTGK
jgi:hypothetical protein